MNELIREQVPVPGFTFPKSFRLRNTAEFQRVFNCRKSAADSLLIVYTAENCTSHNRLGVSVSKKVGNAVVRNRWKRLIREVFRRNPLLSEKHFDFAVVPKRGALPPEYAELELSFRKLISTLTECKFV